MSETEHKNINDIFKPVAGSACCLCQKEYYKKSIKDFIKKKITKYQKEQSKEQWLSKSFYVYEALIKEYREIGEGII